MKVLLIDPPFKRFTGFVNYYYPIGLAHLAAVLKNAGYKVSIFDADAVRKGTDIDFSDEYVKLELYRKALNNGQRQAWQDIRNVLEDFTPDLVGITAMTTKFGSVLKTAEIVKKFDADCMVVAGGPHPTLLPEQTLKSGDIDVAVRGEGERTFLSLIKAIENGSDLNGIKGLSFKKDGRIFHNADREFLNNLDDIPFPDRSALMNSGNYTSEDMGVIMASRGCPFHCSYCCHPWGRRVRYRSAENVIREIRQVRQKYGTRQFEFKDDTFTAAKKWVGEFCDQLIREQVKINWSCTTRADALNEGLVKIMKKAGCNAVKLGIETGSDRILKETKKGVTFDQMRQAAKLLNKHALFWSGYFMIGLPTETEEDIKKTYEFMKELNPYYAGLGVYSPFPQTELFEQGRRMGLLDSAVELEHFFKANPKDYFFIDPSKRVAGIKKEEFDSLVAFLMDGFHRHNTRFVNIARRGWARRYVYMHDPKLMIGDINKVLNWWL